MYDRLLKVDCDNSTARVVPALESRFYTDPEIFELEKKEIFYKSWVCLGHQCVISEPGQYFVARIVDQEILIVRGKQGEIRAFHNACRHRGHRLASKSGKCKRFVCPYHAWTYDTSGQLIGAPNSKNLGDLEISEISLNPVRLEILAGAIFANLDPDAPAMAEVFGNVEAEILAAKPNIADQELVTDNPYPHRCNWKASVENFTECYHCGPVHKYLTTNVIDPASYQLTANGLIQRHQVNAYEDGMIQKLWHFWPNTAIGLYPIPGFGTTLCIRHMYPVDYRNSIYHYRWFVDSGQPHATVREYAALHAETTAAEDGAVAAGVQIGMEAGGHKQGILMADPKHAMSSEHVIAHFQALVKAALRD
jgi:phenylpropionate dioxygenase-like ring-hydroxylating dioxygenase large terminal subunit